MGRCRPTPWRLALLALDGHDAALAERTCRRAGTSSGTACPRAGRSSRWLPRPAVPQAEHLVVGSEQRLVEALVVRVGTPRCRPGATCRRTPWRSRPRDSTSAMVTSSPPIRRVLEWGSRSTYMPDRTGCRPVSTAARLGVHATSVYMRVNRIPSSAMRFRFGVSKPRILLMAGMPTSPNDGVVPHDVDDVRRRAVLVPQLGQLGCRAPRPQRPTLPVLRLEDVVLGVVDDVGGECGRNPCAGGEPGRHRESWSC